MPTYFLHGYVRVEAESPAEADALLAAATGTDIETELGEGVVAVFEQGGSHDGWDDVVDGDELPSCICPPELLARDGFRGGCPVHA